MHFYTKLLPSFDIVIPLTFVSAVCLFISAITTRYRTFNGLEQILNKRFSVDSGWECVII